MGKLEDLGGDEVLALQKLAVECVWRLDHGEAGTIYELFTEDGRLSMPSGIYKGRAAIIEWGTRLDEQTSNSRHVCSNYRFESTGPDTARGLTYLVVLTVADPANSAPAVLIVGEYDDEFKRIDGSWYFTSRGLSVVGQP